MGRQRSVSHMKSTNKAPEKEYTKMGAINILNAEFKTLVIRMVKELRRRVDELTENFNKETQKNIKMKIENIIGSQ